MKKISWLPILVFTAFFLVSLVPFFWYRPNSVVAGADMGVPLDYNSYFERGLTSWHSAINTGKNRVIGITRAPEYFLLKFISLGLKSSDKIEIAYFSVLILFTLLSFYFMVFNLMADFEYSEKTLTAFFASLFYFFNFFNLTRWEGLDRPIIYLMIGVPLVIGFLVRNFRKESLINYLFTALSFVIVSYGVVNPPAFLSGVLTIAIYFIFSLPLEINMQESLAKLRYYPSHFVKKIPIGKMQSKLLKVNQFLSGFKKVLDNINSGFVFPQEKKSLVKLDVREFSRRVKVGIISLVFVLAINLFWIVPTLTVGSPSSVFEEISPTNWLEGISQSCTLKNVIRLMGAWHWYAGWGGESYAPYAQKYLNDPVFIALTYLVPVFVLGGIVFALKKKKFLVFIPLLVLGIIFSRGTNGFFAPVYRFLYNNLILFRVFRSPWFKFSLWTIISYSFFYGFFVSGILKIFRGRKFGKITVSSLFVLFLVFPLLLNYPFFTGSFFDKLWVTTPNYIEEAVSFLENSLKSEERAYFLPLVASNNYPWGYESAVPAVYQLSDIPVLGAWYHVFPGDITSPLVKKINEALARNDSPQMSKLLALLRSKFVVYREDVMMQEEDQKRLVKQALEKNQNLKKTAGFGQWEIYKSKKEIAPLFSLHPYLIGISKEDEVLKKYLSDDSKHAYFKGDERGDLLVQSYLLSPRDFSLVRGEERTFEFESKEDFKYQLRISTAGVDGPAMRINFDGQLIDLPRVEKNVYANEVLVGRGKHQLGINESFYPSENLIVNGDFQKELDNWETVDIGTYYGLPIKSSIEVFGENWARIQSINKTFVLRQIVKNLEGNQEYCLRFTFQNLNKMPLQVGIGDAGTIGPDKEPKKLFFKPLDKKFLSVGESTEEIVFRSGGKDIAIDFYAMVDSDVPNKQMVKNVYLDKVWGIKNVELFPVVTENLPLPNYTRVNSTHFKVSFESGSPAWLVLMNTFDNNWRAYEKGKLLSFSKKVNSYANAFFISSAGKHEIDVIFFPQQLFEKLSYLSGGVVVLLFVIIFLAWLKNSARK